MIGQRSKSGSTSRSTARFASGLALCGFLATLLAGPRAIAVIPNSDRAMKAIAAVNRAAGRTKAIQLELTMHIGDQPPIAVGELISHPSGLARLELRGYNGRVDRYLLAGSELVAAKDGQPLDHPQPMLQPFFLLQPDSETTLRAALETFGVRTEWIGLAPCGDQDCFVIGDPRLAAPLPKPPPPVESSEGNVLDDPLAGPAGGSQDQAGSAAGMAESSGGRIDPLVGPELMLPEDRTIPRLWVDTRELQVRRIDRDDGVFLLLGPMVDFEKLRVPGWFEIHEPGEQVIRFEVGRAVLVNAPPQAFSRKWLLTPVVAEPATTPGAPTMPPAALPGEAGRPSPAR